MSKISKDHLKKLSKEFDFTEEHLEKIIMELWRAKAHILNDPENIPFLDNEFLRFKFSLNKLGRLAKKNPLYEPFYDRTCRERQIERKEDF